MLRLVHLVIGNERENRRIWAIFFKSDVEFCGKRLSTCSATFVVRITQLFSGQ